ncbi:hypothetical protein B0H12DRAFT_1244265 [Mycena haematopus]|nr:hypothetical protein B0H12DRAFT_1244265 [Mycena haematopus]
MLVQKGDEVKPKPTPWTTRVDSVTAEVWELRGIIEALARIVKRARNRQAHDRDWFPMVDAALTSGVHDAISGAEYQESIDDDVLSVFAENWALYGDSDDERDADGEVDDEEDTEELARAKALSMAGAIVDEDDNNNDFEDDEDLQRAKALVVGIHVASPVVPAERMEVDESPIAGTSHRSGHFTPGFVGPFLEIAPDFFVAPIPDAPIIAPVVKVKDVDPEIPEEKELEWEKAALNERIAAKKKVVAVKVERPDPEVPAAGPSVPHRVLEGNIIDLISDDEMEVDVPPPKTLGPEKGLLEPAAGVTPAQ